MSDLEEIYQILMVEQKNILNTIEDFKQKKIEILNEIQDEREKQMKTYL